MINRKKTIWTRWISLCMILLILFMMFSFSSHDADQSQTESNRVVNWLMEHVIKKIVSLSEEQQMTVSGTLSFIVRKGAHFSEYALLGLFMYMFVSTFEVKKQILISWAAATFFAATDEFHQLYVPGRSGELRDVMIDSCGVITGILVLFLIRKVASNCKR